MATPTVVLDACVLYPAPLRDLLLWLAVTGLYRPRWTEAIHGEWMESLLRERPDLARNRLKRTRDLMNQAVPDCLVLGYEGLIVSLFLPDPDDRHVLAAAISCGRRIYRDLQPQRFPRDGIGHARRPGPASG